MKSGKDLFIKRLATLLLVQARVLPRDSIGLNIPKKIEGWSTPFEIMSDPRYWKRWEGLEKGALKKK